MNRLLSVEGLTIEFRLSKRLFVVPDDVSFDINENECVGLVGESGSGKSMTALSIMQLLPRQARVIKGRIIFEGQDLLKSQDHPRGKKISMVFQNPLNSLNPSIRIGKQLVEVLLEHSKMSYREALHHVIDVMQELGIPEPDEMIKRYPFEYSGGMRQRVMIAMAMLCKPKLLIADEPTTALDVTTQAQIVNLFLKLRDQTSTSILFISHDLGVISQIADRIVVMYAGKICEISLVSEFFTAPLHPYSKGLIESIPKMTHGKQRLNSIPGNIPSLIDPPKGCRFHPRCKQKLPICSEVMPPGFAFGDRVVYCWLYKGCKEQDAFES